MAPDKYHRCTRCCAKKNCSCQILPGKILRNNRFKHNKKEERCYGKHCKRFNKPIGCPCYIQSFWVFTNIFHTLKVNLHHHWINHNTNKNGNRYGYIYIFKINKKFWYKSKILTYYYPCHHAQNNPYCQIFLKKAYTLQFFFTH